MAADTQRKQCAFRRTLLTSPFQHFHRKSRDSSRSYDVRHADPNQHTRETWSPITILHHHHSHPGQDGDSGGISKSPNTEPDHRLHGPLENVWLEPISMVNHESNLELAPPNCLDHQDMDFREVSLDALGKQELDPDYGSVSHTLGEPTPHTASPPSPSIFSMELDAGVDPETGERAPE